MRMNKSFLLLFLEKEGLAFTSWLP